MGTPSVPSSTGTSVKVWKRENSLRPVRTSDSSRRTTWMSSLNRLPMRSTPTKSSNFEMPSSSESEFFALSVNGQIYEVGRFLYDLYPQFMNVSVLFFHNLVVFCQKKK